MSYLNTIKDEEDFRIANKHAFKMEQVFRFNLDSYINEYDYDMCEQDSEGDEDDLKQEEVDFQDVIRGDSEEGTNDSLMRGHLNSDIVNGVPTRTNGSIKGKLPQRISEALNGFSLQLAKYKSFHIKMNSQKLI